MDDFQPQELPEKFPNVRRRDSLDHPAFDVPANELLALCRWLRDERGYDLCADVTAVDWNRPGPRFSVFHHLYCTRTAQYIRLCTACADDQKPEAPSVTGLWPAAEWHERETYDMFGIRFHGHPDLRRILMWESYPYHPLRKDFPLSGKDAPLPGADVAEETGVNLISAPMAGGPFHASSCGGPMSHREPRGADESWSEGRSKPAPARSEASNHN